MGLRMDSKGFETAIAAFPAAIANVLRTNAQPGSCAVISAAEAASWAEQLGITIPQLMLKLAPVAATYAITPISNYHVGAVSQGLSGALYFGANIEFSGEALSFCVHAEQAATTNAWVHGEQGLTSIAISAAPCGYCRQFLYELVTAATLEIYLPDATELLTWFLPDAFGPHDLGVEGGLMEQQNHNLVLPSSAPADAVTNSALAAANASYAPYTFTYSGAAVATSDGSVYNGYYAENAAYNPSMSPLEAALVHLNMCGGSFADITAAVLVEVSGPASQLSATQAVLSSISTVPLQYYNATTGSSSE